MAGMAAWMVSVNFVMAEETAANTASASVQTTPPVKVKKASMTKKKNKAAKETKAAEKSVYVCPMCHIKADKPGNCPECGMAMVKETKELKEKAGKQKKM